MQPYDMPDQFGHFGQFGGTFVAETLIEALDELRDMYDKYKDDPKFLEEFHHDLNHFVGRPSPVYFAERLTKKIGGAKIYLKREDLQPVFSFKNRGAYNKIVNLTPKQKDAGVIAASAGNHAQGVAVSCKKLKINCLIVMPITCLLYTSPSPRDS